MAKFLTTRGTALEIENIIKNAKNWLVLISPFVKIPETLLQNLQEADRRKVKIRLVYGKRELKPDERSPLEQLDNLSLYFLKNLHAKCIFNEECMVITSMNLYDSSEQTNIEMGILISVKDDQKVFSDARNEAKLIIASSPKIDLGRTKGNYNLHGIKQKGYCLRCGMPIPYDLDRPYCRGCFSKWLEWENPDYEEYFCHTCGRSELTTRSKPQCYSCYAKSQR